MKVGITTWNAQGRATSGTSVLASAYSTTWGVMFKHYMGILWVSGFNKPATRTLLGMMVEAGRPPGFHAGNKIDTYNATAFKAKYHWRGWQKPFALQDNFRCSMLTAQAQPSPASPAYPQCVFFGPLTSGPFKAFKSLRPILAAVFTTANAGFDLRVYLVHLPSGSKHLKLNFHILRTLAAYIATSPVPAIILGDININIKGKTYDWVKFRLWHFAAATKSAKWKLVRVNKPTQRSGAELDWALAYNCTSSTAELIGPLTVSAAGKGLGTIAKGVSDHAMINYVVGV